MWARIALWIDDMRWYFDRWFYDVDQGFLGLQTILFVAFWFAVSIGIVALVNLL